MNLSIDTQKTSDATRIVVCGEVDVSNAAEMRGAIEAALATNPASLEIDLSDVAYIDSTGIGVLVGAAHSAAEAGGSFAVLNPQPNVKRVLGMLGVEKDLNIKE